MIRAQLSFPSWLSPESFRGPIRRLGNLAFRCSTPVVLVLALACLGAGAAVGQVTLPYTQDFEALGTTPIQSADALTVLDSPGADWRYAESNNGVFYPAPDTTPGVPGYVNSGSRSMTFSTTSASSSNDGILRLDLSNRDISCADIALSFYYRKAPGEDSHDNPSGATVGLTAATPQINNDWVFVRGSSSDPWIFAFDWFASATTSFQQATLDLKQLLTNAGQGYSSTTEVMFRQYDSLGLSTSSSAEGAAFDDISVFVSSSTCPPPAGTVSGEVVLDRDSDGWDTTDPGFPGSVRVEAQDGVCTPLVDCPIVTTTASTSPTGAYSLALEVGTWNIVVYEDDIPIGFSLWGGTAGSSADTNPKSVSVTDGSATTLNFPFVSSTITMPYKEDFEGAGSEEYLQFGNRLEGVPHFNYYGTSSPTRLRMAAPFLGPDAGNNFDPLGNAATVDATSGSALSNFLIFTVDLSAYDVNDPSTPDVLLDYWWMHHANSNFTGGYNAISVRGDWWGTWSHNFVTAYDFGSDIGSTPAGQWTEMTGLNLSAVLRAAGQNFGPNTQIRFRQYNSSGSATSQTASEGITFDDICLYEAGGADCNGSVIGNRIWNDVNGNGVDDEAAELGLEGVTVELLDGVGTLLETTTTDASGGYSFQLQTTGNFTVRVTPPTGASPTYDPDGGTPNEADVTITTVGELHTDKDFGYNFAGSISGTVLEDRDADGVLDVGESPYSGLTVELRQGVTVYRTATTDGSGQFSWASVPPAAWTVVVTTPPVGASAVYNPPPDVTIDNETSFTLADGEIRTAVNFGYRYPRSIAGHIWNDADSDAIEDVGELTLAGLTVTLEQGGSPIFTTTTDSNGDYSFLYLPDGTYVVVVTPPATGTPTLDPDEAGVCVTCDHRTQLTLSGADATGVNFAYNVPPAVISGRVGIDGNSTGILGTGEPAFPGPVTLELRDSGGALVDTTTTAADGSYSFTTTTAGDYTVDVIDSTIPIGMLLEPGTDGTGATTEPATVAAALGVTTTLNFGYVAAPITLPYGEGFELSGGVRYGPDDNHLTGVPHAMFDSITRMGRLRTAAGAGFYRTGSHAATQDRDPNDSPGSTGEEALVFTFDLSAYNAAIDTLVLDFSWMHHGRVDWGQAVEIRGTANDTWRQLYDWGWESQYHSAGTWIDLADLNLSSTLSYWSQNFSETTQIRFRWRGSGTAYQLTASNGVTVDDICIRPLGGPSCAGTVAGGTIWNDLNGDGIADAGEPGLRDLTVELRDGVCTPGSDCATTTTDAVGDYYFLVPSSGTYTVAVASPSGGTLTRDPDGSPFSDQYTFALTAGTAVTGLDFAYQFAGSIAGSLWEDRDADGTIDVGEVGFAGLTVELRDSGGVAHRTATTASDGSYSWSSVGPDDWTVVSTTPPAGALPTWDPDGTGTANQTTFTLADGENRTGQNFGYRFQRSISGRIWDDDDASGTQNGTEPGLGGVTVTLEQGGSPILTATTDGNGDYLFTYIADGTFDVVVTRPAGGSPTYDPDTGTAGPFDDRTQLTLSGSDVAGVNFGYDVQNAIGGYVWADADGDAVRDGGETGMSGVALELRDGVCSPGTDCPATTTDGSGHYEFLGLSAGVEYTIVLDECTLTAGARTSTTDNNPYVRTLAAAEVVSDADFGYTNLLPFFEGFENARPQQITYTSATSCVKGAPAFSYEKTGGGRLQVAAAENWDLDERNIGKDYYRTGLAAATMDSTSATNIWDQNGLVLNLDLSAYDASVDRVLLDFSVMQHLEQRHRLANGDAGDDIVEMRVGAMAPGTWIEIDDPATPKVEGDWQTLPSEEGQWYDVRDVDLSALLLASGQNFDSGFQLRFRQYGNDDVRFPVRDDGVSFDDIRLHLGGGDAAVSGFVWKDWDDSAARGAGEGMPCTLVTLYPDSDGDQFLDLDESQNPVGSVPTGADGSYVFRYLAAGDYLLGVDTATLRHGLSVVGANPRAFALSAGQNGSEEVEVTGGALLPYSTDFESSREAPYWADASCMSGLPDWNYTETGWGRIDPRRDASDYQYSGDRAMTFDSSSGNSDLAALTLKLDLGAYTAAVQTVTLDFAWTHHVYFNQSTYWNNESGGVFVRGSSTDPWLPVLNQANPNDQWEAEGGPAAASPISPSGVFRQETGIDLSAILLAGGQDFSSTFELKFEHEGYADADFDNNQQWAGITIDDVVINGPLPGATIGDRIWNDLNGNGLQDPGEPGIANVGLTLSNGGGQIASTTTDASGAYQFYVTQPGDYTILVNPPAGGTVSWDPDGPYSTEIAEQGDNKAVVSIPTLGITRLDQDFGYFFTGTVEGTVWDDRDADQTQDGDENGIAGVTVELRQGPTLFQTTTTDANGHYLFTSVGPATWSVVLPSPPDGVPPTVQTYDVDGTGTAHQSTFDLQYGEFRTGENFGYRYQAQLSGSIWDDDNEDGVESGESPLAGLTVTLGQGGSPVLVTTTDVNGDFSFQYLPAGTYDVTVTPIPGTRQIYDLDCGATPLGGACAAGSLGHTTTITLGAGQNRPGVDFSYNREPAIGGRVWDDVDADGVIDAGETGIAGVTLELRDGVCSPWVDCPTLVTDAQGDYEFLDLAGSTSYTLVLEECTLPVNSRRLTTANNPSAITLGADEVVDTANLGYQPLTFPFFEGFENTLNFSTTFVGVDQTCLKGAAHFGFETTSYDDASCWIGQQNYCIENGAAGTSDGPTGRLRLAYDVEGDRFFRTGDASASMDDADTNNPGNYSMNDLVFRADLTGYSTADQLLLDFSFKDNGDDTDFGPAYTWVDGDNLLIDVPGETEMVDVVDVRVGSMPAGQWIELYNWVQQPANVWIDVRELNISAAIEAALGPTAYDSGFELRFRQFDNAGIASDGFTMDDFLLYLGTGSASIGDQVWRDLNENATFDVGEGMPCVLVELYDDANGNGLLDGAEGSSPLRSIVSSASGQYGFDYLGVGNYLVVARAETLPTGLGADPVAVSLGATPVDTADIELSGGVLLPYTQGFEGADNEVYVAAQRCLEGLPDVQFETTALPRLNMSKGSGFIRTGQNAATLDSYQTRSVSEPPNVGDLIVEVDLSFYDTSQDLTLDFWWMHHAGWTANYCSYQDLSVAVRGSKSDPWLLLPYDMDTLSSDDAFCSQVSVVAGQWEHSPEIAISPTLAAGGQDYSETFQIRFQWGGTSTAQDPEYTQGLSIDDITIKGPAGTSLGDRVWNDIDGDGVQDAGEPGVPGVTVALINGFGEVVDTDVTATSGAYQLSTVSTGTFRVVVTPPAGGTPTGDPDGTFDHETTVEICQPGASGCTGVPFGTVSNAEDFGYAFSGGISGTVFQDDNGDRIKQAAESFFAGVAVSLLQDGNVFQTTTTDANGVWSFSSVGSGTWTVSTVPPTGTAPTTDPDWPATPNQFSVTLAAGQSSTGNAFGYRYSASISGAVLQDDDADGVRDPGEPGIQGRLVTLLDDGNGSTVGSMLTDTNGEFSFQFLLAGTYRVRVEPPSGTTPTYNPPGDALLDNETTVTLAVGETVTGRDFGYTLPSLDGVVFDDINGNGIRDGGEPGMAGVVLTLSGPGCAPCTEVTDGTGAYEFNGLSTANYSIDVDEDTLTLSGAPTLTTPAALPWTVTLTGLANSLDIGYDALALPGIACTGDNAFFYDFEGLSDSFLPSSSSGPFSGTLTGAPGWSWEVETFLVNGSAATNGKVYTGTQSLGDNIPGDSRGRAVTLHSAGWSKQWITLTADLSTLDSSVHELLLGFDYADHGDDSNVEDRVQIRGSSSDSWITVHTLHPDKFTNDTWIEVRDKNLLSYLAAHGQTPSSTFQLRFQVFSQYMARIGTDLEGITFDNVCLRTGTPPESGRLEGFIFRDYDGDGVRENDVEFSEVGFADVQLELRGPDCAPCNLTTDRGGWYRIENLIPGNYTLQVTSVPGSPIRTKAGPTPIVIRPGDNVAPEFGYRATQVFTENTVMMAKGYAMEAPPPAEIWWVDPTTGSTRRATRAANILNNDGGGPASPTSQDEINSLAANVNSCQVYYGHGTKLYRWDVLEDQHYFISNLATDFPSTNCSTYSNPQDNCFTGTYLDSAGATFWPATNTLYLASEGGPVGRFNISAIHEIVMTPDGKNIASLRRLSVQEDAQAQLPAPDGIYPVGGFGDIVPFDNGGGGVLIVGSTHNNGYDTTGSWEGNPRYYFWTYDVQSRDFTLVKQVDGRMKMFQLGNNPNGTIWAGRSYVLQEIDPATGELVGAPLDVPSSAMIYDMTGFVGACMAQIGVAKRVSSPAVSNGDGTWTVGYTVKVETLGTKDLYDVQVEDQLAGTFGTWVSGTPASPGQYTVSSAPTLQNALGGADLTANPGFDGSSDLNLLSLTSNDNLPVGASVEIAFSVRFYPTAEQKTFVNQAVARGDTTQNGVTDGEADDLSDDGSNVDENGNGYPEDPGEGDPTVFTIDTGYDLALSYQYLSDTSVDGNATDGRVKVGDEVVFRLTLYNQGLVPATGSPRVRVYVDPTLFNGFSLTKNPNGTTGGTVNVPYSWSIDGEGHGVVTFDTSVVPFGDTSAATVETMTLDVRLNVTSASRGSWLAYAEVWSDGNADIDSMPESEEGNDNGDPFVAGVIDNSGGDEDDHDGGAFTVVGGRIGDLVWQDADRDGVRDGGEPGIGGVTLRLYRDDGDGVLEAGTDDVLAATTTTDANGLYRFSNLEAAVYFVVVDETTVPAGYASTAPGTAPSSGAVDMRTTDVNDTVDFGYAAPNSVIGDLVWHDVDADGIRDSGEPGIAGVSVTVLDPDLVEITTVVTDLNGLWQVGGLTVSGWYTVSIDTATLPGDFFPVPTNQPDTSVAFNVVAGTDQLTADFGFTGATTATIGDQVCVDVNGNGLCDAGEGVGSVTLNLVSSADGSETSTSTDAGGLYDFTGVQAGEYFVYISDVNGVLDGLMPCAGYTNPIFGINVIAGQDYNDADFLYCPVEGTGSIGNLVFLDEDVDGVFDPATESGLEFTILELWRDTNGNCELEPGFDVKIATTKTDASGRYLFQGLATPAQYLVRTKPGQLQMQGLHKTIGSIGVDENSQPEPFCINLTDSASRPGLALKSSRDFRADFGFWGQPPYSISGHVFADADSDGVRESGENGVSGAVVYLYRDLDGDGVIDADDPLFGSTTSASDGSYSFESLPGYSTHWVLIADVSGTSVSGSTQTTQTASGGAERVHLEAASSSGHDFGFGASTTLALVSRFEAMVEGGGVVVEWETASEVGTLGFFLLRWNAQAGEWLQVGEFVASPGELLGATYRVADDGADPGAPLDYLLLEREVQGGEKSYGPYQVYADGSSRLPSRAFGATAHVRGGVHVEREQATRTEGGRSRRPLWPADVARITVAGDGVFVVDSASLAVALGSDTTLVEQWIANGQLSLRRAGRALGWWTVSGREVVFHAPAATGPYAAEVDVYAEFGSGAVASVQSVGAVSPASGGSFVDTARIEQNRFAATGALQDPHQEIWFWRALGTLSGWNTASFGFDLPGHTGEGGAELRVEIYGVTDTPQEIDHRLHVWVNGLLAESFEWDGGGRRQLVVPLDGSSLSLSGNELRLEMEGVRGVDLGILYLDAFEIDYRRDLRAPSGFLRLSASEPVVTVAGLPAGTVEVLDLGDPDRPVRLSGLTVDQADGQRVSFPAVVGREYVVATTGAYRSSSTAGAGGAYPAFGEAEYLVIAPERFVVSAERLASYRESQGLSVRTVVLENVYDRYSHGEETPWALQAYLSDLWQRSKVKPRFVVLVGKGTFDYRDDLGTGTNLLPPTLVGTANGLFASDALVGDVVGSDGIPEIAVGRIPVATTQELDAYVDKLAAWEAGLGSDLGNVLLVADNGDRAGDFGASLDRLESAAGGRATERIELGPSSLADARMQLFEAFDRGALWLGYSGHGGLDRMASEGLLTLGDVPQLSSSGRLPIVSALTCTINRFEVPGYTSLGEALVLDADAGAIAVLAPTGLSQNDWATELGVSIQRSALGGSAATLGEAILAGMRAAGEAPADRSTYTLFGDPALALPTSEVAQPEVLFSDDFETGGLLGWSAVHGGS